jgi:hypothetical protein
MSLKKIVVTISAIILFIYPSMNQSVRAEEMKYTGRSSHMMTLQDAASLTKIYRINVESNAMLISYFGKDIIAKVLAQPGCDQVHVYYGMNKDGKSLFMLFGVDKKGNEMLASLLPTCLKCHVD